MKKIMKKASLAVAVAAAMGVSGFASAMSLEAFTSVKIPAEYYNTLNGEEVDLNGSPVFKVTSINPSSITLSSPEADLSAPQNTDYYMVVLNAADDEVRGVVVASNTLLPVVGGAVDGNIVFNDASGLNVRLLAANGSALLTKVNLTSAFRLQVIDVTLDSAAHLDTLVKAMEAVAAFQADGSMTLAELEAGVTVATVAPAGDAAYDDSIRLIVPGGLAIGDTINLNVAQSSGDSDATELANVAVKYAMTATTAFDGVIDVNADRKTFVDAINNDVATIAVAVNSGTFATALDEAVRNITTSIVGSNQAVATMVGSLHAVGAYASGAWPVTGYTTAVSTSDYTATVDGTNPIDERTFTFNGATAAMDNRLDVTYADGRNLGEWKLNGHVAYIPFFPTGTVAAQLRVTNQSDEDNANVAIDAWDQAGNMVASNVSIGAVPANGILTVYRSQVLEALTTTPDGPISLRIVTNAPQDKVMVSGNQIVANQGMADLRTYNGASAAAVSISCTGTGTSDVGAGTSTSSDCTGSSAVQRFR